MDRHGHDAPHDGGHCYPSDNDFLSGRGAGVNSHPANVFFRKLVLSQKAKYLKANPGEKKRIIQHIIQAADDHGRFLKQYPGTDLWVRLTSEEVTKKVGQAVRELSPKIKKQHQWKKRMLLKKQTEIETPEKECLFLMLPAESETPETEIKNNILEDYESTTRSELHFLPSVKLTSSPVQPSYQQYRRNTRPHQQPQAQSQLQELQLQPPRLNSILSSTTMTTSKLILTRMNMLQAKQEQLKRKQRELEDEQNKLLQYCNQMTATAAQLVALSSSSNKNVYSNHNKLSASASSSSPLHDNMNINNSYPLMMGGIQHGNKRKATRRTPTNQEHENVDGNHHALKKRKIMVPGL